MKKILIAVDDTKGTSAAVNTFKGIINCIRPETVILLHVQKPEGKSLIVEMLGTPELATLKEALRGSAVQETLDKMSSAILSSYRKVIEDAGAIGIKTVVKFGHPAEEILKTAREEDAELILIGTRGKRAHGFLMGSVSREVANSSEIPVLLAK